MDTIITKLVQARHEAVIRHTRGALEAWDVDMPEGTSDFQLLELYDAEYSRRAEGYDADGNRYRELSSEDYESIDSHDGWLEGFDAAFAIVKAELDS